MLSDASDTYTWLLSRAGACPACGADLAALAPACAACGRSFLQLHRPPRHSATARALAGAWAIGFLGALLMLVGTLFQVFGVVERTNTPQLLRVLLVGTTGAALFCALMAWACAARQPLALYTGGALSAGLGLASIAGGLWLRGPLGLALATLGGLASGALLFMHIAVAPEFRGELRRQSFAISASSARGLAREGRVFLMAGLPFLAAQCWARALGKEPGNAEYMHALGLALARLGYTERALGQIERAMRAEPGNPEFRRSYEALRGGR